jgi:hypothetical protein
MRDLIFVEGRFTMTQFKVHVVTFSISQIPNFIKLWLDNLGGQSIQLSRKADLMSLLHVHFNLNTGIPRFTSLICSSKTARKAKTRKTKINLPLLPEKRRREQRSVCERKELVSVKAGS